MLVVVSMGSSSRSFAGGSSVIVVVRAEIINVVEVGYPAACMDARWVLRRSRTLLIVL